MLVAVLALSIVSSSVCLSFGASPKISKAYDVIKKGKYVYCCAYNGIYRVNIKTGGKKRIVKEKAPGIHRPSSMVLYKGYLYYIDEAVIGASLYRVKTTGKNKKFLASVYNFAVKKSGIYYTAPNRDFDKVVKRKMKLNGKNKRKSAYRVKTKYKRSNNRGYYVKDKVTVLSKEYDYELEGYWKKTRTDEYLITPSNRIKLCSYTDDDFD